MKSQTFVAPPILGCLRAAENYLYDNSLLSHRVSWSGINDVQRSFVDKFVTNIQEIDGLKDILKQMAHKDAKVINQWLRERGFNIELQSRETPNSFCVASILDVLVKWLKVGEATTITGRTKSEDGQYKKYPAVKLKGENSGVTILTEDSPHSSPIAVIRTKNNSESVRMRMLDLNEDPIGPLAIADLLKNMPSRLSRDESYDSVTFPMIDYDQKVDISWLVGLQTGDRPDDFYVCEAVQQTKFRMNEIGARAQSGVAMMLRGRSIEIPKRTLVMDKPFLLWIERGGIKLPLFAGVFAEDCWKRPESL